MSHWSCEVPNCGGPALLGRDGSCRVCGQHLCFRHAEDLVQHPCRTLSKTEKEDLDDKFFFTQLNALFAKVDIPTLLDEAKRLRPGHECRGPVKMDWWALDIITHGGNVQVILEFDDGVKWLARLPQTLKGSPPFPAQKALKFSEAATFRVLHSNGVKVPQVWNRPGGEHDELNYFFVEFVAGTTNGAFKVGVDITRAPTDRDLIIIESFVQHQLTLEKVTFSSVGSPTFDSTGDNVILGPVMEYLSPIAEPPYYLGPFLTLQARYLTYFDTVMKAIVEDRWCAPSKSLDYYLALLEARTLVAACEELGDEEGPFYIKHGEPKGDHLMVDEAGEITAVIDWEWSHTTSKADAFPAPLAFIPIGFWKEGSNELSLLEKALEAAYRKLGRNDLATFVAEGKKYQRLDYLLTGYAPRFRFVRAFKRSFGVEEDGSLKNVSVWRESALERFRSDPGVIKLLKAGRRGRQEEKAAKRCSLPRGVSSTLLQVFPQVCEALGATV